MFTVDFLIFTCSQSGGGGQLPYTCNSFFFVCKFKKNDYCDKNPPDVACLK